MARTGGDKRTLIEKTKADALARNTKRPPTEAERARAKAETALVKTLRGALRGAGIGRVEITVSGDRVRVELSRAQVERLGRDG